MVKIYKSKFIKDFEYLDFVKKFKDNLVLTKKDLYKKKQKEYEVMFEDNWDRFVFVFNNGYGVSIIRNSYSYGGNKGLWEIVVIKIIKSIKTRKDIQKKFFEIIYDTIITDDVLGYLEEKEVSEILEKIKNLDYYTLREKL